MCSPHTINQPFSLSSCCLPSNVLTVQYTVHCKHDSSFCILLYKTRPQNPYQLQCRLPNKTAVTPTITKHSIFVPAWIRWRKWVIKLNENSYWVWLACGTPDAVRRWPNSWSKNLAVVGQCQPKSKSGTIRWLGRGTWYSVQWNTLRIPRKRGWLAHHWGKSHWGS